MPGARPHVLNFTIDQSSNCDLCVLLNGVQFHITAEESKLKHAKGLHAEYICLVEAFGNQKENEVDGYPETAAGRQSACKEDLETRNKAKKSKDKQDSAIGSSISSEELDGNRSSSPDSGIDTGSASETKEVTYQVDHTDPETDLQNLILQPFGPVFARLAPEVKTLEPTTVHDWYNVPTHFFRLEVTHNANFAAVEIDSPPKHLQTRVDRLTPHMNMPKYLREVTAHIPRLDAKDLNILATSDEPPPIHPCQVRLNKAAPGPDSSRTLRKNETYFLKLVDSTQHEPMKREIKILLEAESKQFQSKHKINIPRLEALVLHSPSPSSSSSTSTPSSSSSPPETLLGILLTPISTPTPLTNLLHPTTPRSLRQKWSKEATRIKSHLHANGIVWGDAKADNFLVDAHDELWIIDFGGSYTAGWVDPEACETEEGDDMGVGKIVDALEDPLGNTWDPERERDEDREGVVLVDDDDDDDDGGVDGAIAIDKEMQSEEHGREDEQGEGDEMKREEQQPGKRGRKRKSAAGEQPEAADGVGGTRRRGPRKRQRYGNGRLCSTT